jgi:hypothetical protein
MLCRGGNVALRCGHDGDDGKVKGKSTIWSNIRECRGARKIPGDLVIWRFGDLPPASNIAIDVLPGTLLWR